ncbi:conserved hypothetical protein [Planktothrix serta PCC 8927]|uniref:TIGR03984 family CRISPR-associated protein n=1 Tax=Planktothrix serta PCC 8927 TaxID=671068 RepID=A0A7Z9C2D4_9CYAN|nr:CRISPR-associated protein Csx19 [Planktothrix serta]VXD25829.1 conserved hypothetical protein [Planktothrix serta PCC 8927]
MNKPICKNIDDVSKIESNLKGWLEEKAKDYHLQYLLAHADDGVIWGRFETDGTLITQTEPQDLFPQNNFAKLRWLTLQQCRIFSKTSEIMLWKVNGQPQSRLIIEPEGTDSICESQILWGTHGQKDEENGFTLLWDGQQGLRHAVPFTDIELESDHKLKNRVRLEVHHYIDDDNSSGVARIYLSRLVDLESVKI